MDGHKLMYDRKIFYSKVLINSINSLLVLCLLHFFTQVIHDVMVDTSFIILATSLSSSWLQKYAQIY